MRYRQLTKLNSTYVEGLLRLTDATGRVHSTFDQVATATGRISSSEPNLQNIPVRTEEGKEIRQAFLPRAGWTPWPRRARVSARCRPRPRLAPVINQVKVCLVCCSTCADDARPGTILGDRVACALTPSCALSGT